MATTTKRCVCDGHWHVRKRQWVVTQRGFAVIKGERTPSGYCELKCRACYRKWRTRASYTTTLPDYQERTYKPLSYEEIIELITADRLRADFKRGLVYKQRKQGGAWTSKFVPLKPRTQNDKGTSGKITPDHLYVTIKDNNRRREISVGRLVWMIYHRKVIPPGYDIDHDDEDPANNAITNLIVTEATVNRGSNHNEAEWDEVPF